MIAAPSPLVMRSGMQWFPMSYIRASFINLQPRYNIYRYNELLFITKQMKNSFVVDTV